MRRTRTLIFLCAVALFLYACGDKPASGPSTQTARPACDSPSVRGVVERFGERLDSVSLLAPDSILVREMHDAYGQLVVDDLLDTWTSDPGAAPGRTTSSPWPARIQIRRAAPSDSASCVVDGDLIYVTSFDTSEVAVRSRVTIRLKHFDEGWRITSYGERER